LPTDEQGDRDRAMSVHTQNAATVVLHDGAAALGQ
jgi:hypothetical protein